MGSRSLLVSLILALSNNVFFKIRLLFLWLDRYSNYWFYIPIIGPHIGAILGAVLYTLVIENHWEEPADDSCNKPCSVESEANGGRKKISASYD